MSAGRYRHRITLQAPQQGQDEIGQPLVGWSDVATLWANVRHISGMEAIRAGAEASTVRASIRIRWRTGVDAGMRALHGARAYEIKAVLADRAAGFVDLACEATNAGS